MRQSIDDLRGFLEKTKRVYVIITFNFAEDTLRDDFIENLEDYNLERQRDQSTFSGNLVQEEFCRLEESIKTKYIIHKDCANTDFVDVYSSDTEIFKHPYNK